MLSRFVECDPLLYVGAGREQLPLPEQWHPHCQVGLQEERRVLDAPGDSHELLPQLVGRPVLCSYQIEQGQPPQDRKELRGLTDLLTQLARAGVRVFHFGRRIAPGRHQGETQCGLEDQFLMNTLRRIWKGGQHLQPFREVCYRFQIG